jgi:hypothetical protein
VNGELTVHERGLCADHRIPLAHEQRQAELLANRSARVVDHRPRVAGDEHGLMPGQQCSDVVEQVRPLRQLPLPVDEPNPPLQPWRARHFLQAHDIGVAAREPRRELVEHRAAPRIQGDDSHPRQVTRLRSTRVSCEPRPSAG